MIYPNSSRVEYRIDGFLDTSRDKLGDDLTVLIDSCCGGFFANSNELGSQTSSSRPPPTRSNVVKSQTLGKKFKVQLESLLNMLTTTNPHYIKCIKPNTMKVPNCFQGSTCFAQLQALGVFEAVAIRKRGFPYRVSHDEFNRIYGPVYKKQLIARNAFTAPAKIRTELLVAELNRHNGADPIYHFLLGKSKVFSKFEARDAAKKLLDKFRVRCAIKIQSIARGFLARVAFCDYCYAAIDANSLLGVPDPENEKYLSEVQCLLKKLQKYPYQHYQRLLEMKARIDERLRLLRELEEMQHVPFGNVNSKWMSRAQYARKKGIVTPAAEKIYEMYDTILRGGDVDIECDEPSSKGEILTKVKVHEENEEICGFKEAELPQISRLMCSLCRKSFDPPPMPRSPRYLSCLHTFCTVCLAIEVERSSGGVMCPNPDCRVLSRCPDGVSSFKIAYALVHQLPPICRNCELKNAVCKCSDCPEEASLLCMTCLKTHNKIKAYKNHSIRGLDGDTAVNPLDMSRCLQHPEKDMDTYCRTCQQLVCLSCAVFTHSTHTIQPYHQAAEMERTRLIPCLSDLFADASSLQQKQTDLNETEPTLEQQAKQMKELSARIFQSLQHSLANRRTDFLSVLDLHYSQKRKALVEFTEALNYHITCQESSTKICSEMLDVGNDTEVLSVSKFLQTHLNDMLENSWNQDLSNLETHLAFSCGPEQDVKNLISSIGICRGSTICADPAKSIIEILQIGEFCQQWQVFIRLTLHNSKGQRIIKGGHAVTIDVEEIVEPVTFAPSVSPASTSAPSSTPLPHGLGKISTRSSHFSMKSAQHAATLSTTALDMQTLGRQVTSRSTKFNTGVTDNQDGTYHLLVTLLPFPLTEENVTLQAINVSIKIFGVDVHESPLLFHPLDVDEMKNYHTKKVNLMSADHPRAENLTVSSPSSETSRDDKTNEYKSVSTFLKYISGGLLST